MQKKLIALAVAGLASTAAFAQSNVTVYGVADVSFEQAKAEGATSATALGLANANNQTNVASRTRVQSNSSLLGFKGSEALGNGLTALFQIETQLNLNQSIANGGAATPTGAAYTTNGTFGASRDSFVGLTGSFGTVLGGYVSTPYRSLVTGFDVAPGAAGAGNINGVFGKATGNTNLLFRTNAVAYASPTFSGFSGVIAYVPNAGKSLDNTAAVAAGNGGAGNIGNGTTGAVYGLNGQGLTIGLPGVAANNTVNPHGWNLGLNYANGGVKVAYSYLKLVDVGVGGLAKEDHKAQVLGASYDFGQGTTVMAMYQRFNGEVGSLTLDRNSYALGAKHVLGANEFAVSYQHAADASGNLYSTLVGSNADTGAKQWTLRYGYNFSKRTQAYALYTKITNKNLAAFDFNSSAANGSVGAALGSDPQAFGVGIRHSF